MNTPFSPLPWLKGNNLQNHMMDEMSKENTPEAFQEEWNMEASGVNIVGIVNVDKHNDATIIAILVTEPLPTSDDMIKVDQDTDYILESANNYPIAMDILSRLNEINKVNAYHTGRDLFGLEVEINDFVTGKSKVKTEEYKDDE